MSHHKSAKQTRDGAGDQTRGGDFGIVQNCKKKINNTSGSRS